MVWFKHHVVVSYDLRFGRPPGFGFWFGLLLDEPLVPDCVLDLPSAAASGRDVFDIEAFDYFRY